jgi:hypothetical protein
MNLKKLAKSNKLDLKKFHRGDKNLASQLRNNTSRNK